ncbi:unnamed protein product [Amoebophrya sp. A120]|nr:unnamed protein product [Amoebophrya sp. A120]|eukprot:GSA120T00000178001.1
MRNFLLHTLCSVGGSTVLARRANKPLPTGLQTPTSSSETSTTPTSATPPTKGAGGSSSSKSKTTGEGAVEQHRDVLEQLQPGVAGTTGRGEAAPAPSASSRRHHVANPKPIRTPSPDERGRGRPPGGANRVVKEDHFGAANSAGAPLRGPLHQATTASSTTSGEQTPQQRGRQRGSAGKGSAPQAAWNATPKARTSTGASTWTSSPKAGGNKGATTTRPLLQEHGEPGDAEQWPSLGGGLPRQQHAAGPSGGRRSPASSSTTTSAANTPANRGRGRTTAWSTAASAGGTGRSSTAYKNNHDEHIVAPTTKEEEHALLEQAQRESQRDYLMQELRDFNAAIARELGAGQQQRQLQQQVGGIASNVNNLPTASWAASSPVEHHNAVLLAEQVKNAWTSTPTMAHQQQMQLSPQSIATQPPLLQPSPHHAGSSFPEQFAGMLQSPSLQGPGGITSTGHLMVPSPAAQAQDFQQQGGIIQQSLLQYAANSAETTPQNAGRMMSGASPAGAGAQMQFAQSQQQMAAAAAAQQLQGQPQQSSYQVQTYVASPVAAGNGNIVPVFMPIAAMEMAAGISSTTTMGVVDQQQQQDVMYNTPQLQQQMAQQQQPLASSNNVNVQQSYEHLQPTSPHMQPQPAIGPYGTTSGAPSTLLPMQMQLQQLPSSSATSHGAMGTVMQLDQSSPASSSYAGNTPMLSMQPDPLYGGPVDFALNGVVMGSTIHSDCTTPSLGHKSGDSCALGPPSGGGGLGSGQELQASSSAKEKTIQDITPPVVDLGNYETEQGFMLGDLEQPLSRSSVRSSAGMNLLLQNSGVAAGFAPSTATTGGAGTSTSKQIASTSRTSSKHQVFDGTPPAGSTSELLQEVDHSSGQNSGGKQTSSGGSVAAVDARLSQNLTSNFQVDDVVRTLRENQAATTQKERMYNDRVGTLEEQEQALIQQMQKLQLEKAEAIAQADRAAAVNERFTDKIAMLIDGKQDEEDAQIARQLAEGNHQHEPASVSAAGVVPANETNESTTLNVKNHSETSRTTAAATGITSSKGDGKNYATASSTTSASGMKTSVAVGAPTASPSAVGEIKAAVAPSISSSSTSQKNALARTISAAVHPVAPQTDVAFDLLVEQVKREEKRNPRAVSMFPALGTDRPMCVQGTYHHEITGLFEEGTVWVFVQLAEHPLFGSVNSSREPQYHAKYEAWLEAGPSAASRREPLTVAQSGDTRKEGELKFRFRWFGTEAEVKLSEQLVCARNNQLALDVEVTADAIGHSEQTASASGVILDLIQEKPAELARKERKRSLSRDARRISHRSVPARDRHGAQNTEISSRARRRNMREDRSRDPPPQRAMRPSRAADVETTAPAAAGGTSTSSTARGLPPPAALLALSTAGAAAGTRPGFYPPTGTSTSITSPPAPVGPGAVLNSSDGEELQPRRTTPVKIIRTFEATLQLPGSAGTETFEFTEEEMESMTVKDLRDRLSARLRGEVVRRGSSDSHGVETRVYSDRIKQSALKRMQFEEVSRQYSSKINASSSVVGAGGGKNAKNQHNHSRTVDAANAEAAEAFLEQFHHYAPREEEEYDKAIAAGRTDVPKPKMIRLELLKERWQDKLWQFFQPDRLHLLHERFDPNTQKLVKHEIKKTAEKRLRDFVAFDKPPVVVNKTDEAADEGDVTTEKFFLQTIFVDWGRFRLKLVPADMTPEVRNQLKKRRESLLWGKNSHMSHFQAMRILQEFPELLVPDSSSSTGVEITEEKLEEKVRELNTSLDPVTKERDEKRVLLKKALSDWKTVLHPGYQQVSRQHRTHRTPQVQQLLDAKYRLPKSLHEWLLTTNQQGKKTWSQLALNNIFSDIHATQKVFMRRGGGGQAQGASSSHNSSNFQGGGATSSSSVAGAAGSMGHQAGGRRLPTAEPDEESEPMATTGGVVAAASAAQQSAPPSGSHKRSKSAKRRSREQNAKRRSKEQVSQNAEEESRSGRSAMSISSAPSTSRQEPDNNSEETATPEEVLAMEVDEQDVGARTDKNRTGTANAQQRASRPRGREPVRATGAASSQQQQLVAPPVEVVDDDADDDDKNDTPQQQAHEEQLHQPRSSALTAVDQLRAHLFAMWQKEKPESLLVEAEKVLHPWSEKLGGLQYEEDVADWQEWVREVLYEPRKQKVKQEKKQKKGSAAAATAGGSSSIGKYQDDGNNVGNDQQLEAEKAYLKEVLNVASKLKKQLPMRRSRSQARSKSRDRGVGPERGGRNPREPSRGRVAQRERAERRQMQEEQDAEDDAVLDAAEAQAAQERTGTFAPRALLQKVGGWFGNLRGGGTDDSSRGGNLPAP